MGRVAVIGKRSFIAASWLQAFPAMVESVSRSDLSEVRVADCDVVANCSINADFKNTKYQAALDDDLAAARVAKGAGKHFLMLSTRKVYGLQDDDTPIDENFSTRPTDLYGANKLESETRVLDLLGDQCTILRISNVFGYEFGRRSFFGIALGRLKAEGLIELDISPFVARDFIPVEYLAARLSEISVARPAGVFNLGSGVGLQLGRIAQWLIRSYGQGELLISSLEEKDSFVLNVSKLRAVEGMNWPSVNFEELISSLGSRLRETR